MITDTENGSSSSVFFSAIRDKKISVIVPVYNEARSIIENLDLLISEISPYFTNYEIIVISDGSTDGTDKLLSKQSHPNVKTILLDKNRGKGYAIRQGFIEGKGDFFLFIDGGMELHPKEIKVLLGLQALYDADIVVGSKRHPQSDIQYPLVRRILSFILQQIVKQLFDLDVTDTQVGLKLFRKEVVEAIRDDLSINRYGFDLEVLAFARHKGFKRMLEAPIRLDYFCGEPRPFYVELPHIFRVGLEVAKDTLRVYLKYRALKKKTPKVVVGIV